VTAKQQTTKYDQACRHFLEKRYDLATFQLPTNNYLAVSINAMDLKRLTSQYRDRLS
jgi:hypothetical protein